MNITAPLRAHAERTPDAPAYARTRHGDYDYRSYDAAVDAVAWRALDAGLRPGHRVAVSVERDFVHLTIVLGLARAGIAAFRPDTPGEPCDAYIAAIKPETPVHAPVLLSDPGWFEAPSSPRPAPMHEGGDAECYRFRTSGTTGRPKDVAITHAAFAARIERRVRAIAPPDPVRMMSRVRARATYGFQASLHAIWIGGCVVEPVELGALAGEIERQRVSWLIAPPGILAPLVAARPDGAGPFASVRRLEVSGSVLSPTLARAAAARVSPDIAVVYGSTETGMVAQASLAEIAGVRDGVGRVAPGLDVEIVDEAGAPLPAGEDGILRIRGPGVATAYVDDAAASTRAFRDGWFYPGDVAAVTADGVLAVRGRTDERVNVGGAKAAPEAIEAVVQTLAGVVDAAAFAVRSSAGIDRVAVAIVAGPAFDFAQCEATCREQLGMFTPEIVLSVREIPRNENGKVDRGALARLAGAHGGAAPTAP